MEPGELIRARRKHFGLSQGRLAVRAGVTQATVSRIENGLASPGWDTIRQLLAAMGEEPVLDSRPLPGSWDDAHLQSTLARSPAERLELAMSWNRLAGQLAEAGRMARGEQSAA